MSSSGLPFSNTRSEAAPGLITPDEGLLKYAAAFTVLVCNISNGVSPASDIYFSSWCKENPGTSKTCGASEPDTMPTLLSLQAFSIFFLNAISATAPAESYNGSAMILFFAFTQLFKTVSSMYPISGSLLKASAVLNGVNHLSG